MKAYKQCRVCDAVYFERDFVNYKQKGWYQLTEAEWASLVIPAEHTYDHEPTCVDTTLTCLVCKQNVPQNIAHEVDWVETDWQKGDARHFFYSEEATCSKDGWIADWCNVCKEFRDVKIIYAQGHKEITVTVPAGIDNGGRIAIRGMGNDGANGGPAGDLIVEVRVKNHQLFDRRGYDIYCDVPITVAEATLGAEIDVPTLEGSKKFTIPEGTQTGTSFSLRGCGVCRLENPDRRGDLIFTVVVETPKGLNSKQRELMRQFAEACGESNYGKKQRFFRKNRKNED
jgi:DnaJ-class molecular chaperone